MTEVIAEYEAVVEGEDGARWSARACARATQTKWEGWIEFVPLSAGERAVRTPIETTQPDRDAVTQWAAGITPTYLEGALERARERPAVIDTQTAPPLFDAPAETVVAAVAPERPAPHPLLDPYEVYAQGEEVLTAQLAALDVEHLRDIVLAYELASPETAALASRADLTTHILAAARRHEVRR